MECVVPRQGRHPHLLQGLVKLLNLTARVSVAETWRREINSSCINWFQRTLIPICILCSLLILEQYRLLMFNLKEHESMMNLQSQPHPYWWSGGRFKDAYQLLNLRAPKFSPVNKIQIFQCMDKVEIPHKISYPYTERCNFKQLWNFKISRALRFKSSSIFDPPPPPKAISQKTLKLFIVEMSLKFTNLRL